MNLRRFALTAAMIAGVSTQAAMANAGCLTGAVVGGIAGHMAHKHALAGAAAGCVVGHELAVHKKKKIAAQKQAAREAKLAAQQAAPATH